MRSFKDNKELGNCKRMNVPSMDLWEKLVLFSLIVLLTHVHLNEVSMVRMNNAGAYFSGKETSPQIFVPVHLLLIFHLVLNRFH